MIRRAFLALALTAFVGIASAAAPQQGGYKILVSTATLKDAGWVAVVDALKAKHPGAEVYANDDAIGGALDLLKKTHPRYVCFVATPEEATREAVKAMANMSRDLDEDPYTDCFWGILTGRDASNALRIAKQDKPLIVRNVASATPIKLDRCDSGIWYSELKKGDAAQKKHGKAPESMQGPDDTTEALVKALEASDLFITSGHASERNWMIGYSYRNGTFQCADGRIVGHDTKGGRFPVSSPGPKVYLPIGNCLMGHVDGPDCMAIAYMNSAGVCQMIGYTVPTGFGYGGWGMLDYFLLQPGRYTMAEAYRANQNALINRRDDPAFASDRGNLENDRTVVAFYGDPAWEARMADGPLNWEQTLKHKGDKWTFTVKPLRGEDTFKPVDTNGSQRGGRPLVAFLPVRVKDARILEGAEWKPVVTDDFILVPNPGEGSKPIKVVFQALEEK